MTKRISVVIAGAVAVLILASCSAGSVTLTAQPPPLIEPATHTPTATLLPATATPTFTAVPPTATPSPTYTPKPTATPTSAPTLQFDRAQILSYLISAVLGALALKVIELLGGKAVRVKEIERAHKIELARLKIRLDSETQEATRNNKTERILEAQREYSNGIQLADRTYEIDLAQLGKVWTWIGRLLARVL